jgi:hypothetical protein
MSSDWEVVDNSGGDWEVAGQQPQQIPKQQGGLPQTLNNIGVGGGVVAGGLLGAVGLAKGYEALAPARNKLAGELINSIIKPRHKEYMFGKNPGQAVAQEGIWGTNLESIGSKVNSRLNELNTYAKQLRSLENNKSKTVDFSGVLEPFSETLDRLRKAPETHGAKINNAMGMVKDIVSNLPEGNLKEVPVETAYAIKKVAEDMQKWGVEDKADDLINKSLKQVYHNIDASIDTAIPELKPVNSRMSNLISAKTAIRNRLETLSKQDPTDLGHLISLPLKATVGSTGVKSGLAKILSEKFGLVAKKGATMLGVYPMLSQAITMAQDPQQSMFGLEHPIDAPLQGSMGSQQRKQDIQNRLTL